MTCAGLGVGAYLVRCHDPDIEDVIQQVRAVKPSAMSALGYEPVAGHPAGQAAA